MNIYWNVVNLALAVPGLRNSLITDPSSISLTESIGDYHQMGKVLLINAGLDVAYITGGFFNERNGQNTTEQTRPVEWLR